MFEIVIVTVGALAALFVALFGGKGIVDLLGQRKKHRSEDSTDDTPDSIHMSAGVTTTVAVQAATSPLAHTVPVSIASGFVGRQRELGALKACLEDSLAGHGRIAMLAGEPGIGKTRTA